MNTTKLVIFDFNRTLYDPNAHSLKLGAIDVLAYLTRLKYRLTLLSTDSSDRKELIDSLGIASYFTDIMYVSQKAESDIRKLMKESNTSAAYTIIVGDSHMEELLIGSKLGIKTIAVAGGLATKEQAATLGAAYCQSLEGVVYEITGRN